MTGPALTLGLTHRLDLEPTHPRRYQPDPIPPPAYGEATVCMMTCAREIRALLGKSPRRTRC